MTEEEFEALLHTLEVFDFPINTNPNMEKEFSQVEEILGYTLADSYKTCMRRYMFVESSYRHLVAVDEIIALTNFEKEEVEVPFGYYVLEYLDDITMLQHSNGEIFISSGKNPIKYCDNLEKYLRETWNDDLVKNVQENVEYSTENAYTIDEIEEAELVLKLGFGSAFREYLRSFSYVGNGQRRLLTLLESVEMTLQMRSEDFQFPKDCYVIEYIADEYRLVVQNTFGIIYEMPLYQNKKDRGFSLTEYILEEMACK